MPKENIQDSATDAMRAEVTWLAGSHVQVATVNQASPFEFPEKQTPDSFQAAERFDGWRVTLDRAGINRMIRALRKARDAAFGADA